MVTSTKANEHPRCSCKQCRRGSAQSFGQFVHRLVNRKIRHAYKAALRKLGPDDDVRITIPTPYTD
jgi:hypothetical protein